MKLLRYGPSGNESPGLLDDEGRIRDLSGIVSDIDEDTIGRTQLEKLAAIDPRSLPIVKSSPRIGPPIRRVRNFIAVGLNYADHARETNTPIPDEPVLFNKAPSSVVGPDDAILLPPGSQKTDWEIELAVVISEPAWQVTEAEAMAYVAGFTICHDVSEREYQIERGGQWTKGKSAPSFGPIGPWLVTPDEVPDVQDLAMQLRVNGETMQRGSTRTMIFSAAFLVAYISRFMKLEPGDVITTGTPPGVGLGMKPPQFLKPGDVVELAIDGLGRQRQEIRAYG
jgi:2-keto-4-pentenoate hydratase/2-oxohepta-3-ene-1,7-dioic acid hydratase in catechol pathway